MIQTIVMADIVTERLPAYSKIYKITDSYQTSASIDEASQDSNGG